MNILNSDQIFHLNQVLNSLNFQGKENPVVALDHLNEMKTLIDSSIEEIHKEYPDWFVRVLKEFIELNNKIHSLNEFLSKDKPENVELSQWELLQQQLRIMQEYRFILEMRIRDTGLFNEYGF